MPPVPAKRPGGTRKVQKPPPKLARKIVPAVLELIVELDIDKAGTAHQKVLAADALNLAETLDAGAGMAAAAISRELRATCAELRGDGEGSDDDDAFAAWEDQLANPS